MKLIGILVAGVVGGVAGAAPVEFTLKINGPDGVLADFPLQVFQKGRGNTSAVTGADGVARFAVDSECSSDIVVQARSAKRTEKEDAVAFSLRNEAFLKRCETLGLPLAWVFQVRFDQGPIDRSVSVPRGLKLTVHPVGIPDKADPLRFLIVPGARIANPMRDHDAANPTRYGVPAGVATTGFFEYAPNKDGLVAVAFPIPASDTDIDIGELAIPPVEFTAKITLHQVWDSKTDKRVPEKRGWGIRSDGVTFVTPDGNTILSGSLHPVDTVNLTGQGQGTTAVPAGTYYVLPGMFWGNHEQMVVISRLRAGQDLSNRGLPMFTIAAGEEKSFDYDTVDLYKAINAIEDGK